ncbi:MAG: PepSY domain-containing protein [Butyricicoccus pullicaecorum]|nr:PepSY domain-containing protein [Butyricicoccus pullicaecorum]
MKNNSVKVFALGAVSACLVMGAAYSAVGASRNIAVEEGIRMQINNTAFVPKDAKGNPVSPFLYNGTTYVPMRPLCEAIGLTVSYDSATKMVSVTAPTTTPNTGNNNAGSGNTGSGNTSGTAVSEDQAKLAALTDAGVTASNAKFTKCEQKTDDGRNIYEIEFTSGSKKYEYKVDAATGKVLDKESDGNSNSSNNSEKISESKAKEIAAKKAGVSDAKFTKCELKEDDKGSVYEIEFTSGSKKYEYKIDAADGSILSSDSESEKDD